MKKLFFMFCMLLACTAAKAQGEANTWMLKFDLGATTDFKKTGGDHDQTLVFDFGAGYNVSQNVYLGVATGVQAPVGAKAICIPMMADVTFSFPSQSSITPFAQLRGGVLLNTKDNYRNSGKKGCNFAALEIQPGIAIKIADDMDLTTSLMYQRLAKASGPGENHTNLALKVGINFHF